MSGGAEGGALLNAPGFNKAMENLGVSGNTGDISRMTPGTFQASAPAPQQNAMPPWMMGQMGNQLMQAGRMPMMQSPAVHRPMVNAAGPGPMSMPPPTMQPMTTQGMNQALAQHTGLMGAPQWQMPTIMRR